MPKHTMPHLIMVMGVSGCGKSTVAEALAKHLNYEFLEADDFHPTKNRDHMAAGQPLTDAMRTPWIDAIWAHLTQMAAECKHCTLSFSGLRAAHRARIKSVPMRATTLHLEGSQHLIDERMSQRKGHFMPNSLLNSQFRTLENPNNEINTHSLNIDCSLHELLKRSIAVIEKVKVEDVKVEAAQGQA